MSNDYYTQLMWLKQATLNTGAIHEAQAMQLRHWSMLVPHAISTNSAVKVDVDKKLVEFDIVAPKIRMTKKVKMLLANMAVWTRTILWDDAKVIILLNHKIQYTTEVSDER